MDKLLSILPGLAGLLIWLLLWSLGGWLLSSAAFRLRRNEEALAGLAIGFVAQTVLGNLLAQLIPLTAAAWVSAGVVFLAGAAVYSRGWRARRLALPSPLQAITFLLLLGIFVSISRGLAIFDDYAHLPTTSLIAAGTVPPQFALDPDIPYGYHYFLMFFAAQLMRLAQLGPWIALDLSRALTVALAVMLGGLWTQRLTRSTLAGLLGGLMVLFGSGSRWLLLFLPHALVIRLAKGIQMLGSGGGSGADLAAALTNAWAVEGAGPVPFPFAFANGIYSPGVIGMNGPNGLTWFVITFLLLLTFNRWRHWGAGLVTALLIAATSLLVEVGVAVTALAWALVALLYAWKHKTLRLPASLWAWLGVVVLGNLVGLVQGGAWTDMFNNFLLTAQGKSAVASYQTVGFQLVPSPSIVSSHLGILWLANPAQLLVALCELGPVLLVFPLLIAWGIKAFRVRRWFEAVMAMVAVLSIGMIFVQFSGSTGVRNTSRLYNFMSMLAVFAVPLAWMWASRRGQAVKALAAGAGLVMAFGGLIMFGVELLAIQRPVYSYFITPMDAQMNAAYWDRLEPGALVFDSNPYRAPTVFGRPTNSSTTWYQTKPEWDALEKSPDPQKLRAAGFSFAYLDNRYLDGLDAPARAALETGCAVLVDEFGDKNGNFRRLLDLRSCP